MFLNSIGKNVHKLIGYKITESNDKKLTWPDNVYKAYNPKAQ